MRAGARRAALPPDAEPEPFCVSVGMMLPHQPFIARESRDYCWHLGCILPRVPATIVRTSGRGDFDKYRGRVPPPRIPPEPLDDIHPHIAEWRRTQGIEEVTEAEIDRSRTACKCR